MQPRSTAHLTVLTEKFFTLVAQGEQEIVTAMMHHTTRTELPWHTIAEVWNRCLTEYGQLDSCADTFVSLPGSTEPLTALGSDSALGVVVGNTTLQFEAGELTGRIAFDHNDLVVGLVYLPVDTEVNALPF